jgi:hypothetical protein
MARDTSTSAERRCLGMDGFLELVAEMLAGEALGAGMPAEGGQSEEGAKERQEGGIEATVKWSHARQSNRRARRLT